MKANELMIGDWITMNGITLQVTRLSKYGEYQNVEPIPLTPEILKKNGFSYDTAHDIWVFKQGEILLEVGICHPDFINISYEYRTPDGEYFGDISTITKVDGSDIMTHELQHALRLCGIEEEIEL